MGKRRTWDADRARELLAQGIRRKDVAKAVGATVSGINGLLYNKHPEVKDEADKPEPERPRPKPKESVGEMSRRAREQGVTYGDLTKPEVTVTIPPGLEKVGSRPRVKDIELRELPQDKTAPGIREKLLEPPEEKPPERVELYASAGGWAVGLIARDRGEAAEAVKKLDKTVREMDKTDGGNEG